MTDTTFANYRRASALWAHFLRSRTTEGRDKAHADRGIEHIITETRDADQLEALIRLVMVTAVTAAPELLERGHTFTGGAVVGALGEKLTPPAPVDPEILGDDYVTGDGSLDWLKGDDDDA